MTAAELHTSTWRQNHDLLRALDEAFAHEIARLSRPVEPEQMHIPVSQKDGS